MASNNNEYIELLAKGEYFGALVSYKKVYSVNDATAAAMVSTAEKVLFMNQTKRICFERSFPEVTHNLVLAVHLLQKAGHSPESAFEALILADQKMREENSSMRAGAEEYDEIMAIQDMTHG